MLLNVVCFLSLGVCGWIVRLLPSSWCSVWADCSSTYWIKSHQVFSMNSFSMTPSTICSVDGRR